MTVCRELFIEEENVVQTNKDIIKKNINSWKNYVSRLLCETEYFIDNSVGFNQISAVSTNAKDNQYVLEEIEKDGIQGTANFNAGMVLDSIHINSQSESCQIPKWEPDLVEGKDSILVYLSVLVSKYNKMILDLEDQKIKLIEYIRHFNRYLKQNTDHSLLPQCDRIVGQDRVDHCTPEPKKPSTHSEMIDARSAALTIIENKRQEMDIMLCDFIKSYKKMENVREAIIMYVNRLNQIWSDNNIEDTKVRLNLVQDVTHD